ncbi:MAG: hypothetical protein U1E65_21425 [Myxococcota bacterium]
MNYRNTPLFLLLALSAAHSASAQSGPRTIPYRGHLDHNGTPQNGVYSMRFELFGAALGGAALATFDQDVTVSAGDFSAALGPVPESVLDTASLYLQISVAPRGQTLVLLPSRQRIQAVPYASRSETQKDFRAENVVVTQQLNVGSTSLDNAGLIHTPVFRILNLLTDNQGVVSGPISWGFGSGNLCIPARANCYGFDLPFDSYNGTIVLTVEATAYKASGVSGAIEIFGILDPNAQGTGLNAGHLITSFNEPLSHKALPTGQWVFPRSVVGCGSPPCHHILRIVPRGGATRTEVDINDYVRVTGYELPF